MALRKLRDAIDSQFPNLDLEEDTVSAKVLYDFINDYILQDSEQYKTNKEEKKLTFGKWKGFSIEELSKNAKGADYLQWLLAQAWCSEDKFGYIHEECDRLKIKKKARTK